MKSKLSLVSSIVELVFGILAIIAFIMLLINEFSKDMGEK